MSPQSRFCELLQRTTASMIRIFLGWLAGLLIAIVIAIFLLPPDAVGTSRTLAFICMALGVWAGVEWDARSK